MAGGLIIGASVSQKRQAVEHDVSEMSSDDDFQPTLYNKRIRKRRKLVNSSKTRRTGNAGLQLPEEPITRLSNDPRENDSVSTRTSAKHRANNTGKRENITRKTDNDILTRGNNEHDSLDGNTTQVRVILRRIDAQPNTSYTVYNSVRKTRQRLKNKESTYTLKLKPGRRQYTRAVLPHMHQMHKYSTVDVCCGETVNERGKRTICDVIDSSDDESILIRGKPRRKKYKREEFTDSFHEAFNLSSSDESSIMSSSDEDMFASTGDENEADGIYPDDRQLRVMQRRTLKYYDYRVT